MSELELELLDDARRVRRDFLIAIEPLRPQLFAYCRGLAGNVWDAEDLVQETLAKAFAQAASSHNPIAKPLPWLIRVATNSYIDSVRRAQPLLAESVDQVATEGADPVQVGEALEEVLTVLPPQERAAVVLKDVFDYPLADIAGMVGSTIGAVKSALHRGRGKLADPARPPRPMPDRAVLEAAAKAFSAYDAQALTAIFLENGEMSIVGMVHEVGAEQMKGGSLRHTFDLEDGVRYTAEVRDFEGEPVLAIWSQRQEGGVATGERVGSEVIRCRTLEGRLVSMADYFFSPELITEIAAAWGVRTGLHGYRYD